MGSVSAAAQVAESDASSGTSGQPRPATRGPGSGAPSPEELAKLIEQAQSPRGPQPAPSALPALASVGCDASFCVRAVDDALSVFEVLDEKSLPEGVSVKEEQVPSGPLAVRPVRHFLRFSAEGAARTALESELTKRFNGALPSGYQLLFLRGPAGTVRTLIGGPGLLNRSHLASVKLEQDEFGGGFRLALALSDEGKRLLTAATTKLEQRRIVIVAGGEARSMPLVLEPITGGNLSITIKDKLEAESVHKALKR